MEKEYRIKQINEISIIYRNRKNDEQEESIDIPMIYVTKEDLFKYLFFLEKPNLQIQQLFSNISLCTIFNSMELLDIATTIIMDYCLDGIDHLRYVSYTAIEYITEKMVTTTSPELWKYNVFKNINLLNIFLEMEFAKWVHIIIHIFSNNIESLDLLTDDETCLYIINFIKDEYEYYFE